MLTSSHSHYSKLYIMYMYINVKFIHLSISLNLCIEICRDINVNTFLRLNQYHHRHHHHHNRNPMNHLIHYKNLQQRYVNCINSYVHQLSSIQLSASLSEQIHMSLESKRSIYPLFFQ